MTHYTLIVGHSFSLCDETNGDPMTDYFPGIWAIKSRKSALKFAQACLDRGDTVTVSDYDNPAYHESANYCIKALGLSQPLFTLPAALPKPVVTSDKPATLAAFKKFLTPGLKITVDWLNSDGTVKSSRETFVKRVQTNSAVLDKNGSDSWLDFGKAGDWVFTNTDATLFHMGHTDGVRYPVVRVIYT